MNVRLILFSYPSIKTCFLGAQKTVSIFSTHNIYFGYEIKKIFFQCALISGALLDNYKG